MLEKIIIDIKSGLTIRDIQTKYNISYRKLKTLLNSLENNPLIYNEIQNKIKENALNIKKSNPILIQNQKNKVDLSQNVFKDKSDKSLKIIILMALTYRLSLKNLAYIYKTTEDDVKYHVFKRFPEYEKACSYLEYETQNEDDTLSKIALKKAIEFLKNKSAKIDEITDRIYINTKNKQYDSLTFEEKSKIAWFPIKYGYSHTYIKNLGLGHRLSTFEKAIDEVSQTDSILAYKVSILNNYYSNNMTYNFYNGISKKGM